MRRQDNEDLVEISHIVPAVQTSAYIAAELPALIVGTWVVRHVVLEATSIDAEASPEDWFDRGWWADYLERTEPPADLGEPQHRTLLVADRSAEGFASYVTR